ncbi:hypothetical protein SAMN02745945_02589 [Peptoclostridium litorale DSM 5388]|uniref:Uncharacterized protein n=1 Tax=Peptoclostridium litorale DSM 5388 TaxID=1121324 RepID=A0A069RER4_PEPLI|nr:hypothetical protein [Peptoclostridium litorale]KDR94675.1 hypothetical protein CLIT_14c01360 [Peptoclostridium litorale DSM 5388]SIO29901.1 hypothetical protein SAMN02745945_02589 [Peptoclostridium litorale DSM 5388]
MADSKGFRRFISSAAVLIMAVCMLAYPVEGFAAAKAPAGSLEGFIVSIFGNTVTLEDYDGDVHTLFTDGKTQLSMDMETVYNLSEFKRGMEVYIEYKRDTITYMDGYSTESFGQIDAGSRWRSGQVTMIDRDRLEIMDLLGNREIYSISPACIVTRGGISIRREEIGEGDRVKLYFDTYDTMTAGRIQVQGRSVLLKGIYKGQLAISDRYDDSLSFEGLKMLKNGSWEDAYSSNMKLSPDSKIYISGSSVSPENLKYYRGKTAYLAVKDFFGSDSVEKMVLKDRFERLYSERIDEKSPYSSQVELSNKTNINITQGSIVVKGGRLVEDSTISQGQTALIVADSSYAGESANVVMVAGEGNAPSGLNASYIYSARLGMVLPYSVETENLYVLQNHDWAAMENMAFYYDEDTFIYDVDEEEVISVEDFSSGKYAPGKAKGKHAYIYGDGDRISFISIKDEMDSLGAIRTTSGLADSVYESSKTGWMVEMRDASDYSAKKEKWMPKNNSVNIILEDALIIKGSKSIEPGDILPGDNLYIVRDGAFARVVYIRP